MTIKTFIEGVGRRAIEALRWDENNPPVSTVLPGIPVPSFWLDKNQQITDPPSFPDHPRNPCVEIQGRGLSPLRGITTDNLKRLLAEREGPLPWISINEDRRIIDSDDKSLIDARVTRFYMSRPDRIKVTLAYPNELQEGPKEVWVKREITTPLPLPIHTPFDGMAPPVGLHASDLRINDQPISDFASVTRPGGREPEEITLELQHIDGTVTIVKAFDLPFEFNSTYPEGQPEISFDFNRCAPPVGKIKMDNDVYLSSSTTYLQRRSIDWLKEAWPEHPIRTETRATRFLEEAIELAQTQKISRAAMHELVDFVMDKDVGDVHKELGDANFCLLSLAEALGYDLGVVTHEVINDAYDRIPQIREKSKLKPKVDHGPEA